MPSNEPRVPTTPGDLARRVVPSAGGSADPEGTGGVEHIPVD